MSMFSRPETPPGNVRFAQPAANALYTENALVLELDDLDRRSGTQSTDSYRLAQTRARTQSEGTG